MPTIEFLPADISIDVPPGMELLEAARQAGVEIEFPCGGKGTCGNCAVRVASGEVVAGDSGVLPDTAVAAGYVLACKARAGDDDATVTVPPLLGRADGKFSAEDESFMLRAELLPREWEFDPPVINCLLEVPPPRPEDGLADLDRLTRAIQNKAGRLAVGYTLRAMRAAADALRTEAGLVTVTLARADGKLKVIRVAAGDRTTPHYALAVDVGTTTVAAQLIRLAPPRILATRSCYNDQVACGLDVISRINYAQRPGGLDELRARALASINRLLREMTAANEVDPAAIRSAVVSGNTTMNHLLLGLNPEYIRLAPYTPTAMGMPYLTAGEVGLEIDPDAWVCFSPNTGSYVGGDITAGLLCTDLAAGAEEVCLFIDIGTNGEIVVGNSEFLLGCACSAGPAFEGGGIGSGMRAAAGAIEKVEVNPETGAARCETIGGGKPRGICGSGMIGLLANLFRTGWLDPAGKLERERPAAVIQADGKRARYLLVPAAASATGEDLVVSELDIENIIRAKAAIYSGCALLLAEVGIGFEELARIYIAGGFGRYLDLDEAIAIGLLPDVPREKFRFLGNASLMGSCMVAVSRRKREQQLALAERLTYIDLGARPGYMDQYTAALFLPHTDPARFPSVAAGTAKARESR